MDQNDPEKRIAELERQLAAAKSAAGQDHAGEPPPQFSDTQPIALHGTIADPRSRRNARFRAHGRAMYAQYRRKEAENKLIGWTIGAGCVVLGLWATALALTLAVFPSSALWTSGIVCSSSYHLEYDRSSFGPFARNLVSFRCVGDEGSYSANGPVLVFQALLIALLLAVVITVGFVMWRLLRKRR